MDEQMLQRGEALAHEQPGLACRACRCVLSPCRWIRGAAGQPDNAGNADPGADVPTQPDTSHFKEGWDVSVLEEAWRKQIALAHETYVKFGAAKDLAVKASLSGTDEVTVGAEHFDVLRKGSWFLRLDQSFNNIDATMMDGTGASVHPKAHLRTIDFTLQGEAQLEVTKVSAEDLAHRFPGDPSINSRAFVRAIVTIPSGSFPSHGAARYLVGGQVGHRLSPTVPLEFNKYWNDKARGYAKYGPTFVQFLDSFISSQHLQDKVKVPLSDGNFIIMPLADKTRPIEGGEKVIVRGHLLLDNLQRLRFLFPKKQGSCTLLFESVDGYLEGIALSSGHLQISLLVPQEDDVSKPCHSHPFGQDHPAPKDFYHHHNSYSRVFNVDPMTGRELISLAGASQSITLPAGTTMEQTDAGAAEVGVGALVVGGIAAGGAVAGGIGAIASGVGSLISAFK